LDGPIYVDLSQHTSTNGTQIWQIKDVYYGGQLNLPGRLDTERLLVTCANPKHLSGRLLLLAGKFLIFNQAPPGEKLETVT
jgi:hypothetical protein